MARIVLVHGAFNELWGPHELKARWLPALRDGLWHHGVEIADRDVEVCFYGDLFRRAPGTEAERRLEASRPGIAEALSDFAGAAPIVFAQLDPPPVNGKGVWPGSIERWVNVRALGDKAAAVPLAEKFGGRAEDVLIDNGRRSHAPEPYLNAAPTGAAIAAALREAK